MKLALIKFSAFLLIHFHRNILLFSLENFVVIADLCCCILSTCESVNKLFPWNPDSMFRWLFTPQTPCTLQYLRNYIRWCYLASSLITRGETSTKSTINGRELHWTETLFRSEQRTRTDWMPVWNWTEDEVGGRKFTVWLRDESFQWKDFGDSVKLSGPLS